MQSAGVALRHWVCTLQYPGKEKLLFGTLEIRREAGQMEVEEAMTTKVRRCLPDGFKIISCVPGALFFGGEA